MNRKYKIVHLVETLDAVGGMEQVIAEITMHLNREEFEPEIWCVHRGGKFADELSKQGITVRVLKISNYYNPLNILKLAGEFKRSRADIIHTHMYFASTIGRLAGWLAGVKVLIAHVHSSYWHYSPRNLFIERVLSRMTNKIICVSKHTRDFVIDHEKIDPSRVEIIYNGITCANVPSKQEARASFNTTPEEFIIISVANLLENKGHRVILDALKSLNNKNIKCWFIGQGPLEKELKDYTRQLGLDARVAFWGERRDVPNLLTASDVFILASLQREGLSISVLEALAYQVPVIATRVGGSPEIIEDKINGLLIAPQDPDALALAIEGILGDQDRRLQYAISGKKKFQEQFECKVMVTRIEKLYKDCLDKHA